MTPPEHLVLDDPAAIRRLRADLDAADFSAVALRRALHLEEGTEYLPAEVPVHARRLSGDTPFEIVTRLFWLGVPVDAADVERAFPGVSVTVLGQLGLLEETADGVEARIHLVPFDPLILACDRAGGWMEDLPPDHVAGVHPPSVLLANLTVRGPVERALDMATGLGIQALLAAAHARHVVATDINPRALHFLAFNMLLNDVHNVEAREGSFFEPVEGQRFDLVTCNPPYVVSPENRFIFRDGGLRADAVSERVLREAPNHLAEGGFASILASWVHRADQPWREPLDAWLSGSGCDALYLHLVSQDPLTTAANWNRPVGHRDPAALGTALDRWLAYYREIGAEAVAYGSVILRRRMPQPHRPNALYAEQLPAAPVGPAGDIVLRMFAAYDDLAAMPDDAALLDRTYRVEPRHRLEQVARPSPAGYEVEQTVLTLEAGIPFRGPVDPLIVAVLSRCDGDTTLRDVVAAAAQAAGIDPTGAWTDLAPVLRRLLVLGILDPA